MNAPVDIQQTVRDLFDRYYKKPMLNEGPRRGHEITLLFGEIAVDISPIFSEFYRDIGAALAGDENEADAAKTHQLLKAVIAEWVAQIVDKTAPDMVVQFSTGLTPVDMELFKRRVEEGELLTAMDLQPHERRFVTVCSVENRYHEMNMTRIEEVLLDDDAKVTGFNLLDELYGEKNDHGPFADLYTPHSPKRQVTRFDVSAEAQKSADRVKQLMEESPSAKSGLVRLMLEVETED